MGKSLSTDQQRGSREGRFTLPWDLIEWHSKETLLRWIRDEVETLDWANPELVSHLAAHPTQQPKPLLCLLTYAYVTGVYESEEIVRMCYRDDLLRDSIRARVPEPPVISRFRRDNRGLLKWSLEQVLKHALREKLALGETWLPAGLRTLLTESAIARLDLARHMDRGSRET